MDQKTAIRELTPDERKAVAGGNQPTETGGGCLGPTGPKKAKT